MLKGAAHILYCTYVLSVHATVAATYIDWFKPIGFISNWTQTSNMNVNVTCPYHLSDGACQVYNIRLRGVQNSMVQTQSACL